MTSTSTKDNEVRENLGNSVCLFFRFVRVDSGRILCLNSQH